MRLGCKKSILVGVILILLVGLGLNAEVSIRQGVGGHYREIKMPLYVKAIEFLARHYQYIDIAKEITRFSKTDEEKTLAIFKWVHENIKKEIPKGVPIVDDHILNIIIRGYGTSDQSQDVFTTLCSYSGVTAFWERTYDKDHRVWYPVSFVKLNGSWRVFDPYHGKYFKTKNGDIASIEDILNDSSLVKGDDIEKIVYEGVPYKEFYRNLGPVNDRRTLRPEKQKPVKRMIFEVRKILGMEKEGRSL